MSMLANNANFIQCVPAVYTWYIMSEYHFNSHTVESMCFKPQRLWKAEFLPWPCVQVVETCHNAGISKLVVKLRPIAVIKG